VPVEEPSTASTPEVAPTNVVKRKAMANKSLIALDVLLGSFVKKSNYMSTLIEC
jgi:hypothetical protein